MTDITKVTLVQQISEVGREIGLRRNVYPGFVAKGKMRQGEADEHIRRMEAALATLKWLEENRDAVMKALEALKG